MLRGILGLSFGTAISRGLAALGQVILVLWLSPAEFGYWAAATSVISLLTGFANFGEVNGYLSGQGSNYRRVARVTRIQNTGLAFAGLVIAMGYYIAGNPEVGLLAVVVALTIPLVGDAERMYSTGVKYKRYKLVVAAQIAGAVVKLVVGVTIAMTVQSAIALAVSTLTFYLVMDLVILASVHKLASREDEPLNLVQRGDRLKWAANSFFMTLPLQAGFLVAQFVASPVLLGIYYFAYQVTLGISGLVSVPLARVSLATLSALKEEERLTSARRLCALFGAGVLVVASLVAIVAPLASGLVPQEWSAALPAVVVLLASLPARMMGPVLDAFQQSNNRWWQGTFFNVVDSVGTGLAALTALTGDVLLLVATMTGWKIFLSFFRTWMVLREDTVLHRVELSVPVLIGGVLLTLSVYSSAPVGLTFSFAALLVGAAWLIFSVRAQPQGGVQNG